MKDLNDWIKQLENSKKLIIVEGKKDKKALEEFGIKNIMILNKSIYKIVEEIETNGKECILLLDLDSEGKKLYSILRHQLQKRKIKIDNKFREFLFKETNLRNIEGLTHYYSNNLLKLSSL